MALTIQQFPTTPNMANNNLVYAVTSNSSSAPQFQYVCDVFYSGSATLLQRIKQQPNPSAVGVFDLGSLITNYLNSDNNWDTAEFATSSGTSKRFTVKFGEQYGTSLSSSVILYAGNTSGAGLPAVTASAYHYFIDGLVDPNDKIDWNWPSGSYFTASAVSTSTTFNVNHALTNAPTTQSIQDGEYATISLINGNFNGSTTAAQDVYAVSVKVYDTASTEIDDYTIFNTTGNGGGPRTATSVLWNTAAPLQTAGTQLVTMGVGPANLAAGGNTLPSDWSYYIVRVLGQQASNTVNESGSYATIRYNKQNPNCSYDGVRFAWKNEFGVWDYYTFTLQTDKSFSIERAAYEQTFVPFNDVNPIPYSKERRGSINYYNKLTQTLVANSDWLTQAEADWLKELFFSANVFQQDGSEFYPVVITSADLTEKSNPRTQRNFQYQIAFQPANQKNPRV
jgi:hypothetical protein